MEEYVAIGTQDLLDLVHSARRYCDRRCTFAPSEFNKLYKRLLTAWPDLAKHDQMDKVLHTQGKYWPYAQDGHFDEDTGCFDARM